MKKNSPQKHFQAQSSTYASEKKLLLFTLQMNDIYWKRRTMTVDFQRTFGILERWKNNQVTASLSKPHELSYRSNTSITTFFFVENLNLNKKIHIYLNFEHLLASNFAESLLLKFSNGNKILRKPLDVYFSQIFPKYLKKSVVSWTKYFINLKLILLFNTFVRQMCIF